MLASKTLLYGLLSFISLVVSNGVAADGENLSRQRRYLAFPKGSSVSIAVCMTTGILGSRFKTNYLTESVNWGVSYELPNITADDYHNQPFNLTRKLQRARRSRRDLYEKLILFINQMGYDGRACVAKILCEVAQYLPSTKGNMVEEILKTVFSFPKIHIHDDDDEHFYYEQIYHRSKRYDLHCTWDFQQCPLSLIDWMMGKYDLEFI